MILHDKRLIFVHIQKTGGESISAALGQNFQCPEKHFFANQLRQLYGSETWSAYFKFAFVRNPWDRLVSWWSMIDAHREAAATGAPMNVFHRFVLEKAKTFDEFLENCDEEIADSDGLKWIFRNQLDYLTDSSGRQIVDFVGRFERISDDFDLISTKFLGERNLLSHLNKSSHRHYANYFTPALAKKVERNYERDIEAFGYVFGQD